MIDHAHQRLQPDVPLANLLVAVFVCAAGVLAVVEVDGFEPIQPNHAVEIRQHVLQMIHDVVSRVADVAGVQTHAELVIQLRAVDNRAQLLECPPDFRALARHRFQQDGRFHILPQNRVEHVTNLLRRHFHALLDVAAGVKVVQIARQVVKALEVVEHGAAGEIADGGVSRAAVEGIGRVGDDLPDAVGAGEVEVSGDV